jgi:hypothetical protein
MGGGGVTRGDITNSWGGQEASASEKKRGMMRGGGAARSGQVEKLPDRRRWRDKKLRWGRTRATQQPAEADERNEPEDRDLAELEVMMA